MTYRKAAASLNVSPSTFNRLVMGKSNVSPEMALRLSKAFGRSPESWLAMQNPRFVAGSKPRKFG
ncbi:HigA family addiction module antidote protein [Mariprofundus ferrooxydans]|nr:HigA family addiction module antidote protein [Mariprofundus ferrooxydans]MBN4077108.1 HigA family addiction module antidote protein [Mariprofundus ferrooxydans]